MRGEGATTSGISPAMLRRASARRALLLWGAPGSNNLAQLIGHRNMGSDSDSRSIYYDFREHPELIEISLEDFIPFAHRPAPTASGLFVDVNDTARFAVKDHRPIIDDSIVMPTRNVFLRNFIRLVRAGR
jgi:hypothetical protein